jgi:hypothetical protein
MKDDEDDSGKVLEGLDYKYWCRMPGWTVTEAAALLLDLDPDRPKKSGKDTDFDAKEWEYFRLRRLMKRAETMDLLSSPMSPREFLQWAMSNNIPRNEKLEGIVTSTKRLSDWRKRYFRMKRRRDQLAEELEDKVLPKERLTFLKLVLGMARAKFAHKKGGHNTVGQIHDSLEKKGRGITLAKDSIKKYLDEADERIDDVQSSETKA